MSNFFYNLTLLIVLLLNSIPHLLLSCFISTSISTSRLRAQSSVQALFPRTLSPSNISFIYLYSIDHTDVEFVIRYKYKYKQFVINIVINKLQLYTNTISDRKIHVIMGHKFEFFLTYQTPIRDESKYSTQLIHIKKYS